MNADRNAMPMSDRPTREIRDVLQLFRAFKVGEPSLASETCTVTVRRGEGPEEVWTQLVQQGERLVLGIGTFKDWAEVKRPSNDV